VAYREPVPTERTLSQTHPVPSPEPPSDPIREIAVTAARAADAKGGRDPVVLEVAEVLALCELFVITSGTNDRQVRAICDEVEARVHEAGGPKPLRIEGLADLRWVLMDYGDVVVHVFAEEDREFYDLERLWADVPRIDWQPARR
jgi:ribosome-associated protein